MQKILAYRHRRCVGLTNGAGQSIGSAAEISNLTGYRTDLTHLTAWTREARHLSAKSADCSKWVVSQKFAGRGT